MLRETVRRTRLRSPFRIDAWVVLPDHMHCLWTPACERVKELLFPKKVIPGRPEGPSPEPKNASISNTFDDRCSWVPGSQAVPATRNDDVWHFFTRSSPGQAPAAGRCRLPRSLARHQNRLCEILAKRRAEITGCDPPQRARDLAATVLGTRDPRRTGFRRAHGLYAFQPGPADWPRSSFRRCVAWPLSRRMDRRQRRAASDRRAAVKSATGEHRAHP